MNEQRQQAYLNLIQNLLNCRSNNEILEILVANQDLLDAGQYLSVNPFSDTIDNEISMVLAYLISLTEQYWQGDVNTANWLQDFVMQLGEALNPDTKVDLQSLSEEEIQAYFQFLIEVLQATESSLGDAQVVYPLLAKNIDKLDGVLAEMLRQWGTNKLGEAEADEAEYLAAVIVAFSNLIAQFPVGNKATNMEIAITGDKVALTVYTCDAFPYKWAVTQNSIGTAYLYRIRGERADNLERAIAYYQKALKVCTFDAFPVEWAMTQNNLGIAYCNRIRGERADNLERAIAYYQDALTVRTFDAFPYEWAVTQNSIGTAYLYRIRGERADNLERAIVYYQESLEVCTFDAFPVEWAMTQNNLANTYCDRIRGERADNLERAIAYYQDALKVYTFDAFPYEWAMTQNNLGIAYCNKIRGEQADNLERAIIYYEDALTVRTFDAFPYGWAMTQNNLANAYLSRIRGERADNLERAIVYYQESLEVYTFDAFPYEWANTQNNLANAYCDRIRGEWADNLERAIIYYQESLKVYTFDTFPYEWARTQNNLATAYGDRITGKRADNLELAITSYKEALKVHTFDAFPVDWATTQSNLAKAYLDTITGKRAENLEQAIACLQEALKVYTFDNFPYKWAQMQNNLGLVYSVRIRGEQADNLERAIVYYQEALKVYTFLDAFPQDWAGTQNNLANAYSNRIRGERADNLERAIAYYQQALKVRTFDAFPQNHAESLWRIGIAYQNINQLTLAYNTFASAIATVESLREEIVSGEESKRKQAEYFNEVYGRMVEVCLELDKIEEGIEYVERSKTRNLVEQILERDSKTIFSPEVAIQLEKYRDEIATGQYQIQNGKAENPKVIAQRLQELRQQRNELQNRYLPVGYGFKFDSFQVNLDEHTAIIEWYILKNRILAFILTPKERVTVWQSQPEDQQALIDWADKYWQYYNQKDQRQISLGEELKKLASILHIDEILTQIPKQCDQLILIPHWFLHLFPLHALPVSQNHQDSPYLLDLFAGGVSYAPSCQILQQVQQRERPVFQSLFAIQNPTEDLIYTDLEVDSILNLFSSHQVLPYKQATKDALLQQMPQIKEANYLHFSCHGSFNLNSPQDSCLLLTESIDEKRNLDLSKCLTLGNLFEREFQLDNCRLVVLSACETGLVDFRNTSDEYISLPSGFLCAGSTSVVSSLWAVNDLSTAFLMIRFSQNIQTAMADSGDFSVAVELQKAQLWLRDVTTAELQAWASKLKLSPQVNKQLEQFLYYCEHYCEPEEKQFQNPYHWAAFCAIGL